MPLLCPKCGVPVQRDACLRLQWLVLFILFFEPQLFHHLIFYCNYVISISILTEDVSDCQGSLFK